MKHCQRLVKGARLPLLQLLLLGCTFISSALYAQEKKAVIKGLIESDSGNPLQGVTVSVKQDNTNRSIGTTRTNAKGLFSLETEASQGPVTISFSHVGYVTQTIRRNKLEAGSAESIQISLVANATRLEEVVVTALGVKREERALGYAATKISGEKLTDAVSGNWLDALSGKVAGLNLVKAGGPGGSIKVILRGENSLLGESDALIVLDGVIISSSSGKQTGAGGNAYSPTESPVDFGTTLNDINPDDIEEVTVLKGPGAAALYGARGANGAIIITTKSGKPVQKGIGVTLNSNFTLEQASRFPDYQYEYGQGTAQANTWYSYGTTEDGTGTQGSSPSYGPKFDGQSYYQYDPATGKAGTVRTPWVPYKDNVKDFFRLGQTYANTVTVEGGTARSSARFSYTNLKNEWIMPNTGYNRNTVSFSLDQRVTDKLRMSTKINFSNRKNNNLPNVGYNNNTVMFFMLVQPANANLDWYKNYWMPGLEDIDQNTPLYGASDNPYMQMYEMLNKSNRNGVTGNVSATYDINSHLNLVIRTSLDMAYDSRSMQKPKNTYRFQDGMYRTQNVFSSEMNSDFMLKYNGKLAKDLSLIASVGGSVMTNRYIRDDMRADKLRYPGIYNFANSLNTPVSAPYRSLWGTSSLYGLVQLSYRNYLYLDVTGRQDWTSTLALPDNDTIPSGNISFFYPSVNTSVILSELLHLPKAFSYLKWRASVAAVGSGSSTPYLTSYTYGATDFPSGLAAPTRLPNVDLKPLLTTSLETGITAKFLNGRIGLDVAVYRSVTKDQIFPVAVDPAVGYSSIILNAGKILNKGLEAELDVTPVSRKAFSWKTYGNFTTNRNKVVELFSDIETFVVASGPNLTIEARPGGSLGAIYGRGYVYTPDGQILYNDQGIPLLTDTAKYIGDVNPKWKIGWGNEIRFKNFRLNFLFDGQFGGKAFSLTHALLGELGRLKKTIPGRYDGIIGDGVIDNGDGTYRKNDVVATNIYGYYYGHFQRYNIESNTFSTDFIKLRELRLDYTFAPAVLKKLKLQKATLGVFGRNLFMITNWPAFDPEFGTLNSGVINSGFEVAQFPPTRTMGVNLTVGF